MKWNPKLNRKDKMFPKISRQKYESHMRGVKMEMWRQSRGQRLIPKRDWAATSRCSNSRMIGSYLDQEHKVVLEFASG